MSSTLPPHVRPPIGARSLQHGMRVEQGGHRAGVVFGVSDEYLLVRLGWLPWGKRVFYRLDDVERIRPGWVVLADGAQHFSNRDEGSPIAMVHPVHA